MTIVDFFVVILLMSQPNLSPDFRDDFNARSKERLLVQATILRLGLIKDAVDVFKGFQLEDSVAQNQQSTKYRLWLAPDALEVPLLSSALQSSRSFVLVNKTASERLRFHIPVPEDYNEEDEEALEAFELPSDVYVERMKVNGKSIAIVGRYAINALSMYESKPTSSSQDGGVVGSVDLSWAAFDADFEPGITLVSGLSQDLINWHAIKQREITVNPDGSASAVDL
ncbi:MAG: hypothetical protein JWN82_353 [Candidatus Saccharibacteria bacterium]|nr:hypothetical protein [Candidatus Saccharibacteria bacterium]